MSSFTNLESKNETKYTLGLEFDCAQGRIEIPVYLNRELKLSVKTLVPNVNKSCLLSLVKRASDRLSLSSENKDIIQNARGLVGVRMIQPSNGVDRQKQQWQRVKENRLYSKTERAKAFGKLTSATIAAPVTSSVRGAAGAVGSSWIPLMGTLMGLGKGLKRGAVAPFEAFLGDRYLQLTDTGLVVDSGRVPFEFVISHLKFPHVFGDMVFTLYLEGTFHIINDRAIQGQNSDWKRAKHEALETFMPWNYHEGEEKLNLSLRNIVVSMEIVNARMFPSAQMEGVEFRSKSELKDLCRSHKNCIYFNINS